MTEFLNNQVVKWNGEEFRILATLAGNVALCRMDDSRNLGLRIVARSELHAAKQSGALVETDDRFLELRSRPMSDKGKQRAEEAYRLVEPIIRHPECIFSPNQRGALIDAVAGDNKVVRRKLFRLLSIYYQRGQCRAALNPNYVKSEKRIRTYKAKPGRRPVSAGGVLINEDIRSLMDKICREKLLKVDGVSVAKAHKELLAEYRAKHPEAKEDEMPTERQLRYFYMTRYSAKERSVKRYGKRTYAKDIDALTGTTYDITDGPGAIYEIDATLADVYLTSELEPGKPVGRPYVYSVVDTHTGMIVGIHASFEPPQFKTACDALYIAMTDKTKFCSKYGIELGGKHWWDVKGIPSCIVADNAELQTDRFESFLSSYGTVNSFTASGRADCKGTVERSLGLMQQELNTFIDAAPDKILLKKAGHQEKRHKACLNLHDFTQMLIRAALVTNKRLRTNTPKYLPATVASTPETLWRWGLDHCLSSLKSETNEQRLRIVLLPKCRPTLSEDGITANKVSYFCKEARDEGYFERRAVRPDTSNMLLAVDPDNVSQAYFFPDAIKKPLTYWVCTLAACSGHLQDMSQQQAQDYLTQSQIANRKAEQHAAVYQSEMIAEQKETVKRAKQRKPETGAPVAAQIAGIQDNRKLERQYQAQKNARVTQSDVEQLKVSLKSRKTRYSADDYPDDIDDIPD